MSKTYTELSEEQRKQTYKNYQELCKQDSNIIPFESWEEYDDEQKFIDLDFDENTLECLG